jgi:hypothetical protein
MGGIIRCSPNPICGAADGRTSSDLRQHQFSRTRWASIISHEDGARSSDGHHSIARETEMSEVEERNGSKKRRMTRIR